MTMKTETLSLDAVVLDPANVRKHSPRNIEAIRSSLARFGQQKPIVVDSANVVRAGNGTVEAARSLGWTEIEAVRSDLAGSEMVAFAIADNRTAELAEWDWSALGTVMRSLHEEGFDLQEIGFEQAEIGVLLGSADEDEDAEMTLEAPAMELPDLGKPEQAVPFSLAVTLLEPEAVSQEDLTAAIAQACEPFGSAVRIGQ